MTDNQQRQYWHTPRILQNYDCQLTFLLGKTCEGCTKLPFINKNPKSKWMPGKNRVVIKRWSFKVFLLWIIFAVFVFAISETVIPSEQQHQREEREDKATAKFVNYEISVDIKWKLFFHQKKKMLRRLYLLFLSINTAFCFCVVGFLFSYILAANHRAS